MSPLYKIDNKAIWLNFTTKIDYLNLIEYKKLFKLNFEQSKHKNIKQNKKKSFK